MCEDSKVHDYIMAIVSTVLQIQQIVHLQNTTWSRQSFTLNSSITANMLRMLVDLSSVLKIGEGLKATIQIGNIPMEGLVGNAETTWHDI